MKIKWIVSQHIIAILLISIVRARTNPPNIVVLFADNLGYNDIGSFGAATARTPHVDSLVRDGIKLNNWNSAAHLCSASRAALLTGKYPVRTGVYPGVFKPDAMNGLLPKELTIANYLKEKGYATSIVGKWHLGHQFDYLPINHGFDSWYGIPYHMSGGSIDGHVCGFDVNETAWLPLFGGNKIEEQPVNLRNLAQRYASKAKLFMRQNVQNEDKKPFFLYLPFSHVHQLCAPQLAACQWASNQFSDSSPVGSFVDAVEEMDWIVGEVLSEIDALGVSNKTLVLFTSDNGPWVAEQSCSGSKGPFEGRWLRENVDDNCTACPHDYVPSPTTERPRRCVYPGREEEYHLDGVHCGADTGLGSVWEANLRMPAIARWPNHIQANTESMAMVSTLDVLPTILKITEVEIPTDLDGVDISSILFNELSISEEYDPIEERVLFFWRDGFQDGPLPPPYGRVDVAAVKVGPFKAWFYTKSAHYNDDKEVYHDPPLLFNVIDDPAEAYPLNTDNFGDIINHIKALVKAHKENMDWEQPLTLARDQRMMPCSNEDSNCRTTGYSTDNIVAVPE